MICSVGERRDNGSLPINPSGGLKSKGHPIGATGVSMHALTAMQLRGEAGDMQVKDARLGGILNMGGVTWRTTSQFLSDFADQSAADYASEP